MINNKIKEKPITYEEVQAILKNKHLSEYTKQDTIDRYLAYGSDSELNSAQVQKLFIKYKLYDELMSNVEFIEDRGIIQELLKSDAFKNKSIHLIDGKITDIGTKTISHNEDSLYASVITMKDRNTNKFYKIIANVSFIAETTEEYKANLQQCKDNLVAVVVESANKPCLKCWFKKYDDIKYQPEMEQSIVNIIKYW